MDAEKSVGEVTEKETEVLKLNFNQILNQIGQFGRWQQQIFFWVCIVAMVNGVVTVSYAFTAFVPKYRCALPFCESNSNWTYYEDAMTETFYDFVTAGIPSSVLEKNGDCRYIGLTDLTTDPSSSSESCEFYLSEIDRNASDVSLMECNPENLIFDKSLVQNSIVSDFGLTCDRLKVKNAIGSVYMVGVLIGSICVGLFADRFGRLTTLVIGAAATAISGIAGAFVNSPEAFAFFRFLTGFSVKGLYMMAFILAVESVGPKFAAFIGIATNIPFAIGELILGLEAYFIRDWRTLQILVHAPVLFLILLWFVLPESPRWLIAAGRIKEAEIILKRAAKVNKKTIPQHILKVTETKEEPKGVFKSLGNVRAFVDKFDFRKDASHANTSDVENKEEKSSDDVKKEDSFLDLFRPRAMMWRTFNLCFQWFSVTFVYYGLSFGSTSLSGDPYSNFCLNIFVEIPGYLFAMSVMDCWGRKPILAFCQILPGLACIFAGLLAENTPMAPLQIFLSLVGKFGASAGFSIVYLYSAELYPTILRSTSLGTCSLVARFGSILSLLVELTSSIWSPFPMVLMGVVSVVAGFVAFFLPETAGQPLPETKAEALEIGKVDKKRNICSCICPNSWKDMFPCN